MAVKLSDALLRRTEAGSAEYPGEDAVASAAGIMAEELDWTPDRIEMETADLRRAYHLPG
jgi:glycerol-3-phosphate dehydrogenase